MNPTAPRYSDALQRLLGIMNDLRSGCPWDRKQTMQSLRHLTIEETYELSDAILSDDHQEIRKELGDLLLHIIFYSKIAHEQEHFDLADVIESLCDKLVRRHPHVYGDEQIDNPEDVKRNWEQIKLQEQADRGEQQSVLAGVPQSLPALLKALRIQDKVRGVGFEWDNAEQVWAKVEEEMQEFHDEVKAAGEINAKAELEFGDLLFSLVNYARFVGINPETALERTNQKFSRRFQHIEQAIAEDGKDLTEMPLDEMDQYWERAKLELREKSIS